MPRKGARPPRAPKVASGQAYGQRQAQTRTLASIPAPSRPAPSQGGGGGPGSGGPVDPAAALNTAATNFQPPALTPLDAPTQRPNEPVTTGLPVGAGAGPEALGDTGEVPVLDKLRAIYRAYPNPDLLELIMRAGGDDGF